MLYSRPEPDFKCLNLNELLVPGVPDLGLLLGVAPDHLQLAPAAAEAHSEHLLAHRAPVTVGGGPGRPEARLFGA